MITPKNSSCQQGGRTARRGIVLAGVATAAAVSILCATGAGPTLAAPAPAVSSSVAATGTTNPGVLVEAAVSPVAQAQPQAAAVTPPTDWLNFQQVIDWLIGLFQQWWASLFPPTAPPTTPPTTTTPPANGAPYIVPGDGGLYASINDLRASLGVPPLTPDPYVTEYAQNCAINWSGQHCTGGFGLTAENFFSGGGSCAEVAKRAFQSWKNEGPDGGHYRAMVHPQDTKMGVGMAQFPRQSGCAIIFEVGH